MKEVSPTRPVPIWDAALRLFHWITVLLVAGLWVTAELGKLSLHMLLGEVSLALVLFRLGWGFLGSPTARFAHFVKGPGAVLAYLRGGHSGPEIGHNPLGALSVLALIGMLAALGASGLFASDDIFTEGPLAYLASGSTVATLSTAHRVGFKVLLALVALHLAAILFYRLAKGENLVLPMLTGRKRVPPGTEGVPFASPLLALALAAASAALVFGGLAVWGR